MAAAEPTPAPQFVRRLASRLSEIQELRHALADWASHQGVPIATTRSVNLILDELITNVIEHGYRDQPTCHIDVEATLADGAVMVRVTDQAPPFDPLQSRPPDTSADIDQRHIGGLGVLFARRLADELSYRLLDPSGPAQANEVRFVKRFRPLPPAGSVDA